MVRIAVKSSSANYERQFSRMVWMISKIRASITPANANMRLTVANQLPQKRRLLDLCDERKLKRSKLEKSLYELKRVDSPFAWKWFTLFTELWTSLRDCSLSFIFFQNHVPYQIIILCQWFQSCRIIKVVFTERLSYTALRKTVLVMVSGVRLSASRIPHPHLSRIRIPHPHLSWPHAGPW